MSVDAVYRAFCRWLSANPSVIGKRVWCGLYELKHSGTSPSLLATLAKDVAELERLRGGNYQSEETRCPTVTP